MNKSEGVKLNNSTLHIPKRTCKVVLLTGTLLIGMFSYAQEIDSLQLTTASEHTELTKHLFKYPIAFSKTPIKNFTQTEVYGSFKKNEFSRKQTAKETSIYGFKSQGLYSIDPTLKLLGELSAERITEKDVPWNLSEYRTDDEETINAMYFFVPRSGDWVNQKYALKAGIVKTFNRFEIALNANFTANKFSRNEKDPRPDITANTLGGTLQLGYEVIDHHHIFGLAGIERLSRDYSTFYNDKDINIEANPDYYLRFNAGLGRVINSPVTGTNTFNTFNQMVTKKIGGGYNYQSPTTLLSAVYAYQRGIDNLYDEKFKNEDRKIFQTRNLTHQVNSYFQTKKDKLTYLAKASYLNRESQNYDVKHQGSNYKSTLHRTELLAGLKKEKSGLTSFYLGTYGTYNQNQYTDLLTSIHMEINSLTVGVFAEKDLRVNETNKMNIGINFGYYTPIKHQLVYENTLGETPNELVEEVIKHDYAYSTINQLNSDFTFRFIRQLDRKNIVFYTQLKSLFALENNRSYLPNLNTNTTYSIHAGIQLNY